VTFCFLAAAIAAFSSLGRYLPEPGVSLCCFEAAFCCAAFVLPDDTCADAAMVPASNVAATIADSKPVLMGILYSLFAVQWERTRARPRSFHEPTYRVGRASPHPRVGGIPVGE
jgi:hypothetical protein